MIWNIPLYAKLVLIHYDHSNVSRVFETLLMYVRICYLVGSPISDIIAT